MMTEEEPELDGGDLLFCWAENGVELPGTMRGKFEFAIIVAASFNQIVFVNVVVMDEAA